MAEESIELLAPNSPDLKNPERCAYKEGRKYHEQGLTMMQVLSIISTSAKSPNSKLSKPLVRSMESMWYFNQGIDGDMCELELMDWKGKDYCKEGCKLDCEYRTK
jgi:hypothetical protein